MHFGLGRMLRFGVFDPLGLSSPTIRPRFAFKSQKQLSTNNCRELLLENAINLVQMSVQNDVQFAIVSTVDWKRDLHIDLETFAVFSRQK